MLMRINNEKESRRETGMTHMLIMVLGVYVCNAHMIMIAFVCTPKSYNGICLKCGVCVIDRVSLSLLYADANQQRKGKPSGNWHDSRCDLDANAAAS
jgi:hypothetical protein